MTAHTEPTTVAGDDVVAVAESVARLVRAFGRNRARMLAAAAHDVEWSAHLLLKCLANEGPLRLSAVAEHVHADPSTVSRQVAALVREGLVERRADPEDGRATLLVLTEQADVVLRAHDKTRNDYFATMLAGWSEPELRQFAGLMGRFTQDYEAATTEWLSGRGRTDPARQRGTTE